MGKVFPPPIARVGYDPFLPSPLTYTLRFQYLAGLGVSYSGPGATETKLVTCRCCCQFVRSFQIWRMPGDGGQFFLVCLDCHSELEARIDSLKHVKN